MILRPTKLLLAVAALLAGCAPDAPTGAAASAILTPIGKFPPVILPDGDPFGGRFEVNDSTSPSEVTSMSYVTLNVIGGVGIANYFDNGTPIGGGLNGNQVLRILVDEASNGNHAYTAALYNGQLSAPSSPIALTVAVHGGAQLTNYTTFGGLGLTSGQFNAVTTRPSDDSIVAVGQILHGGYNAALMVDFAPGTTALDLEQDSRESAWTAVAIDPRTGYRALAGWANNGGQRDLVVSVQGPPQAFGQPSEKFHVEYNAANLDDEATGIAVNASDGSVAVGGFETRPGQGRNGWVTKYDANGNSLWTQIIADSNNGDDVVTSLAIDPNDDSVIVGGYEQARVTLLLAGRRVGGWGQVGFVAKYGPDGVLHWLWTDKEPVYDGPGVVQSIAVSSQSVIGFGGFMSSPNVGLLDTIGNLVWRGTTPAQSVLGVAVDPLGNLYVNDSVGPTPANASGTGTVYPPSYVFKYSPLGRLIYQAAGATGYGQMIDLSAPTPRYLIAGASYGVPFVAAFAP